MPDPAAEAAQRAWDELIDLHRDNRAPGPNENPWLTAKRSAREALKPIRELHKPAVVRSPDDEQWTECTSCYGAHWPCDTAKLIYTTEELDQ
ncbi:hypothetical protein A5637_13250 [Mycolicibacterium fortuitum]|uniref:hypothetical protein n=1 Tax=Mycolicibacterium fortuitum TaxID=1766 RepID=UPI0007ED0A5B|nr:hypothetical protein [Mycolicibacterium fortuitum]OBK04042.1 hypothetical protein A5637_13250 [Mycolicibacterium fortuitum]